MVGYCPNLARNSRTWHHHHGALLEMVTRKCVGRFFGTQNQELYPLVPGILGKGDRHDVWLTVKNGEFAQIKEKSVPRTGSNGRANAAGSRLAAQWRIAELSPIGHNFQKSIVQRSSNPAETGPGCNRPGASQRRTKKRRTG